MINIETREMMSIFNETLPYDLKPCGMNELAIKVNNELSFRLAVNILMNQQTNESMS